MNDADLNKVIHDLNTSRYQLEAMTDMLKDAQVPSDVYVLQKSILEKITAALDLVTSASQSSRKGKLI